MGWVKLPEGFNWEISDTEYRTSADAFSVVYPEEVGLDSKPLVELSKKMRKEKWEVRSFLIVKEGKLVWERYAGGTTRNHNHSMYSVTKSVLSLLLGICFTESCGVELDESIAKAEYKLPGLLPAQLEGKESIRLKDVLRMTSGMGWDSFPKKEEIRTDSDPLAVAWEPPLSHPPGTKFEYSNGDSQLAAGYLEAKTGNGLYEYAKKTVFSRLNIQGEEWNTATSGRQTAGFGLRLRAIDMAKIGQLYLDGGRWNGRQLVRPEWIAWTFEPGTDPRYGLHWWLHEFEGSPAYMATGKGGQFIYLVPSKKIVIVLTSAIWDKSSEVLLKEVLDALSASLHSNDKIVSREKEEALRRELKLALSSSLDPKLSKGLDEVRLAIQSNSKVSTP
ncbi:serine hydrolase domain-containing protein [Leptospira perolatii]|nr:serine hydrolase [Leptospira perolatii]